MLDPKMGAYYFTKWSYGAHYYKWPKIHVFHWGYCYFNPISGGKIHPIEITGDFCLAHPGQPEGLLISPPAAGFPSTLQLQGSYLSNQNPGMT